MRIHVLALGESLCLYEPDGSLSIGVNDIWKSHTPEIVVCMDPPNRFSSEKLKSIVSGNQNQFITFLNEWNGIANNVKVIPLAPQRHCFDTIGNPNQLTSAFGRACSVENKSEYFSNISMLAHNKNR